MGRQGRGRGGRVSRHLPERCTQNLASASRPHTHCRRILVTRRTWGCRTAISTSPPQRYGELAHGTRSLLPLAGSAHCLGCWAAAQDPAVAIYNSGRIKSKDSWCPGMKVLARRPAGARGACSSGAVAVASALPLCDAPAHPARPHAADAGWHHPGQRACGGAHPGAAAGARPVVLPDPVPRQQPVRRLARVWRGAGRPVVGRWECWW